MLPAQVVVIAKEPVPGRVKTRLTPPFTPAEAAALAEAALTDTLTAVADTNVARRVLALDGAPGPWLPRGFDVIGQRGAGLDERIAWALTDAHVTLPLPLVLIGMDTPQVTPALLAAAAEPLVSCSACARSIPPSCSASRCRSQTPGHGNSRGWNGPGSASGGCRSSSTWTP
jgi:glycosyltransferase A (GT-A) superfamily protein (DUF2064 family)